eukprot:429232-Rhodomonas_salina.2
MRLLPAQPPSVPEHIQRNFRRIMRTVTSNDCGISSLNPSGTFPVTCTAHVLRANMGVVQSVGESRHTGSVPRGRRKRRMCGSARERVRVHSCGASAALGFGGDCRGTHAPGEKICPVAVAEEGESGAKLTCGQRSAPIPLIAARQAPATPLPTATDFSGTLSPRLTEGLHACIKFPSLEDVDAHTKRRDHTCTHKSHLCISRCTGCSAALALAAKNLFRGKRQNQQRQAARGSDTNQTTQAPTVTAAQGASCGVT